MNIYVSQFFPQILKYHRHFYSVNNQQPFQCLKESQELPQTFALLHLLLKCFIRLNLVLKKSLISPLIFLFFFLFQVIRIHSPNFHRSLREKWGTPWTGCKSITEPQRSKRDKQAFTLSPKTNLELSISLTFIFLVCVRKQNQGGHREDVFSRKAPIGR